MTNITKIVEELSALTVMEAAELSKLLEEKWGFTRRVRTHFSCMRCIISTNAIDPAHWKFLTTTSNGNVDLPNIKRSFHITIMRLTDASTIQAIETPSSSSAFPGRWGGRGLLSFVAFVSWWAFLQH